MIVYDISIIDLFISLMYIILILIGANFLKPNKKFAYARFFMPYLYTKIGFAVLFVLIHSYYYKGGDTYLYFNGGKFIAEQIINRPDLALKYLFSSYMNFQELPLSSGFDVNFFKSTDVFLMSKLTSIFSLICFNQFMASSILFSIFSAFGIWKLFKTLCSLYPSIDKYFAIGILFYPTIGIWGSGILKDPLALSAVGYIFNAIYLLFQKRKIVTSTIYILISIYICVILKPYILYTFIPVMLLWFQGNLSKRLKNRFVRFVITPLVIVLFFTAGYFTIQSISESAGKYSLDNVQSVAEGFHSWHTYLAETRNQSGYNLGEVEFTFTGILEKSPAAIVVTFFRPFIFTDVRNVATGFEAIQSFILLLITIYVIIKVKIWNFFKILFTNNDCRAFMLFALIFGISVGLTSYNFGALSRYKIPCLPFFTSSLAIIYFQGVRKLSPKFL